MRCRRIADHRRMLVQLLFHEMAKFALADGGTRHRGAFDLAHHLAAARIVKPRHPHASRSCNRHPANRRCGWSSVPTPRRPSPETSRPRRSPRPKARHAAPRSSAPDARRTATPAHKRLPAARTRPARPRPAPHPAPANGPPAGRPFRYRSRSKTPAPPPSSSARSSAWFSMMPLCTTETRAVPCGCALPSVGAPCVAQRVWPIPVVPGSGCRPANGPGSPACPAPAAARYARSPVSRCRRCHSRDIPAAAALPAAAAPHPLCR